MPKARIIHKIACLADIFITHTDKFEDCTHGKHHSTRERAKKVHFKCSQSFNAVFISVSHTAPKKTFNSATSFRDREQNT